jgi:hypothetical protein
MVSTRTLFVLLFVPAGTSCLNRTDIEVPDWEPPVVGCIELAEREWPGPPDGAVGEDWASRQTWDKDWENSIGFVYTNAELDPDEVVYDTEEELLSSNFVNPDIGWGHAWSWTADRAGTLTIDTEGSEGLDGGTFDAFLGVAYWSTANPDRPSCIGDDDSGEESEAGSSRLGIDVTSGMTLDIAVGGSYREQGTWQLNLAWEEAQEDSE